MPTNHELWYGEAKQGLDLGSTGFATLKATRGIPAKLKARLEKLSCYDTFSDSGHVRYCFSKFASGADTWFILSRASLAQGYSKRAGFFCHHVAIHADNLPAMSPSYLHQSRLLESRWDGVVEELPVCRPLPLAPAPKPIVCRTWQNGFGDSAAAAQFLDEVRRTGSVYLPIRNHNEALALIDEATSLLPAREAWQLTYTSYISSDIERESCIVKGFPSPAPGHLSVPANRTFAFQGATIDDADPLVMTARTGKAPQPQPAIQSMAAEPAPEFRLEKESDVAAVSPSGVAGKPERGRTQRSQATPQRSTPRQPLPPAPSPIARASVPQPAWIWGLCGTLLGLILVAVPGAFVYFSLTNVNKELELQNTQLNADLERTRTSLASEKNALAAEVDQSRRLGQSLAAEQQKYKEAQNQTAETSRQLNGQITELTDRIGNLETEKIRVANEHRAELTGLQDRLDALGKQLEQLRAAADDQPDDKPMNEDPPRQPTRRDVVTVDLQPATKPDGGFQQEALDRDWTLQPVSIRFSNWPNSRTDGDFWQKYDSDKRELELYFDDQKFAEIRWIEATSAKPSRLQVDWVVRLSAGATPWKFDDGELNIAFEERFVEKLQKSELEISTPPEPPSILKFRYLPPQ